MRSPSALAPQNRALYRSLGWLRPDSLVIFLPSPTVATAPQTTGQEQQQPVYPLAALRKPKDWDHRMAGGPQPLL